MGDGDASPGELDPVGDGASERLGTRGDEAAPSCMAVRVSPVTRCTNTWPLPPGTPRSSHERDGDGGPCGMADGDVGGDGM